MSLNGGTASCAGGHDGRELFFLAPDSTLMAVPIQTGSGPDAFEYQAPVPLFRTQVVVAGSDIYPGGPYSSAQYVVASDGRFLMNVDATDAVSPVNIVLNWTAGLRNRCRARRSTRCVGRDREARHDTERCIARAT